MTSTNSSPYLNLLRNQIDITQVPFSDRGSRLLVYQYPNRNQLFVKLAERISGLEPGLEAYLNRPPFIDELALIDEEGHTLDFNLVTTPDTLYFQTELGEFGLVFQDLRTISVHVPADQIAGLRFCVRPQFWNADDSGGELKSIRNL
jgi:hypothetical protein